MDFILYEYNSGTIPTMVAVPRGTYPRNSSPISLNILKNNPGLVRINTTHHHYKKTVLNTCNLECVVGCNTLHPDGTLIEKQTNIYPAKKKTVNGKEVFYCAGLPTGETTASICPIGIYSHVVLCESGNNITNCPD